MHWHPKSPIPPTVFSFRPARNNNLIYECLCRRRDNDININLCSEICRKKFIEIFKDVDKMHSTSSFPPKCNNRRRYTLRVNIYTSTGGATASDHGRNNRPYRRRWFQSPPPLTRVHRENENEMFCIIIEIIRKLEALCFAVLRSIIFFLTHFY